MFGTIFILMSWDISKKPSWGNRATDIYGAMFSSHISQCSRTSVYTSGFRRYCRCCFSSGGRFGLDFTKFHSLLSTVFCFSFSVSYFFFFFFFFLLLLFFVFFFFFYLARCMGA
ncbi:hypothetical protein ACJQWK_04748 [Exserohilum turcicum]